MLPSLEGLSYKERMVRLVILTLKPRKLSSSPVHVYKITTDIDKENSHGPKDLLPCCIVL